MRRVIIPSHMANLNKCITYGSGRFEEGDMFIGVFLSDDEKTATVERCMVKGRSQMSMTDECVVFDGKNSCR